MDYFSRRVGQTKTSSQAPLAHAGEAAEQAGHAEQSPANSQRTILVVENETVNRRLMEQILCYAGYHCILAANGEEALDALDHFRIDLVLMDLSMPVLDGFRATERMRQRPECASLPVVAVSAHAMGADRELALRSGCTEYLTKPFRPVELVRLVEQLLAGA